MRRAVEPEWLDELSPADPRAIGSRRDLVRLNAIMSHVRLMSALLRYRGFPQKTQQLAELGAGDGSFALRLVRSLQPHRRVDRVILVDRLHLITRQVEDQFAALDCRLSFVCADVFEWLQNAPPGTVMVTNLFLHHFESDRLKELLQLAADRCLAFAACEPRRSWFALAASLGVRFIGCNDVTRHDAPISVRGGFANQELSQLWPSQRPWYRQEKGAGLFTHTFLAHAED